MTFAFKDGLVDKSTIDFFIDISEITRGKNEGFYF
jgi:hypothetical protein